MRVLDAFHVVRLGFAADDVRRRIQREQTGHRGRHDDPLYGIRRVLRRGYDHHSERSWAWIAAQDLRLIYHSGDRARAEQALYPMALS